MPRNKRRYIPVPIRERAKQITYLDLPWPVNRFKTAKNQDHIKANQHIFRQVAALLFDYEVTTEEAAEVWAIWEDTLRQVVTEGTGRSVRLPFTGTIRPYRNAPLTGVKEAFPPILRDFFKPGKMVDFSDWVLNTDGVQELHAEAMENMRQSGYISLQNVLMLFARKIEEQKAMNRDIQTEEDNNGAAVI
jgi:hypothetical protein